MLSVMPALSPHLTYVKNRKLPDSLSRTGNFRIDGSSSVTGTVVSPEQDYFKVKGATEKSERYMPTQTYSHYAP